MQSFSTAVPPDASLTCDLDQTRTRSCDRPQQSNLLGVKSKSGRAGASLLSTGGRARASGFCPLADREELGFVTAKVYSGLTCLLSSNLLGATRRQPSARVLSFLLHFCKGLLRPLLFHPLSRATPGPCATGCRASCVFKALTKHTVILVIIRLVDTAKRC